MADSKPFTWPPHSREAAAMLARGDAWKDIPTQAGMGARTLARWHRFPEFVAEVERRKEEIAAAVQAEGIANQRNRIAESDERWQLLRQLRRERAADPSLAKVPGGKGGLVVRTLKVSPGADPVEEFALDTGYLHEMRALEAHIAKELGQIVTKTELSGPDGKELIIRYVGDWRRPGAE